MQDEVTLRSQSVSIKVLTSNSHFETELDAGRLHSVLEEMFQRVKIPSLALPASHGIYFLVRTLIATKSASSNEVKCTKHCTVVTPNRNLALSMSNLFALK